MKLSTERYKVCIVAILAALEQDMYITALSSYQQVVPSVTGVSDD